MTNHHAHIGRHAHLQTVRPSGKQTDRQIDRRANGQPAADKHRQASRQTAREPNSQTPQLPSASLGHTFASAFKKQSPRLSLAGGHTASNAPDLFRPPKLSGAGPGYYWGGGPPGKTSGCCQLFLRVHGACFRASQVVSASYRVAMLQNAVLFAKTARPGGIRRGLTRGRARVQFPVGPARGVKREKAWGG